MTPPTPPVRPPATRRPPFGGAAPSGPAPRRHRPAVSGVALAALPLVLLAGCSDGNGAKGDGGNRPDPRQVNQTIQPVTPGPATDGATPPAKISPQTTGENTSPGAAGK